MPGASRRAVTRSRIVRSPAITATKLTPFRMKHQPSPTVATRTPATAGPRIRAMLKIDELSAMAFGRSSRLTISTRKACRAGMSNALTIPRSDARMKTSFTVTRPASVSAPSAKARSIEDVWVATRRLRRFCRSATAPPRGARRKIGICPQKPASPRRRDEPVSR